MQKTSAKVSQQWIWRQRGLVVFCCLGLFLMAAASAAAQEAGAQKILIKSAWGSDDPTKASFAFNHAIALAEAGHSVQIFLLGEAVSLMRTPVSNSVIPVGWPPLAESLARVVELQIPIHT